MTSSQSSPLAAVRLLQGLKASVDFFSRRFAIAAIVQYHVLNQRVDVRPFPEFRPQRGDV